MLFRTKNTTDAAFGILFGLLMNIMIQCVHIAMKAGPVMILVQRGNNQILESVI